ncbi:porin [Vibrio sp. V27_P1S3P104]|uniref:porin n=1 Tax=unclassified Vibrio TaxID=2614977 RepID=UPI001372D3E2|nr:MULTISPECIES: porin [unclassified Vibrio]NAW70080.1 porin [Vibrio sp. V28_P6S34P95]NAX06385.1 porin [Vibrio sp. V30_P3S12P165]NAX34631.1 porin [Vibrio sp. V29_P1S30P107]NAX37362.1 porin [Vibrio sp. V27_P1S3P104]NNN44964.1 porin [Vibrio sp. 1-1(7)]
MKQAVVATAIFAALASGSAMAATVYKAEGTELKVGGRAEARFNISDNNESDSSTKFKDKSRARFNLVGKTTIADDLYGFGKYEAELDGSDNLTNRYFFAGLGTSLGAFSYGKQDSAQVMLTNFTDIMATFGADAADIVDGNKDKRTNNFLYSAKFDALSVQANYLAGEKKQANGDDDSSFGIALKYDFNMFTLGLGYVGQDNDDKQFNLAASITPTDSLSLAALFVKGEKSSEDIIGYELAAKFKANKQLDLVGVYNFQENDDTNTDLAKNFAIEAVYKFNGNIRTYAGYKFEQLNNKDDQLQAGIRYDF